VQGNWHAPSLFSDVIDKWTGKFRVYLVFVKINKTIMKNMIFIAYFCI